LLFFLSVKSTNLGKISPIFRHEKTLVGREWESFVDKVKFLFCPFTFSPPPLSSLRLHVGGLEGPDSIAKKLKECPSIICVGGYQVSTDLLLGETLNSVNVPTTKMKP
jgi:hypothetical protein